MQQETLLQPFEIIMQTLDDCPKKEHRHLFFELVYIAEGTGIQCVNENKFVYKPGHLFLLTPEDCHSFTIETTTTFFFLRFSDVYLHSEAFSSDNLRKLEYILQNANHQPGCILKNPGDKPVVKSFIELIQREMEQRDLYNTDLVRQMVNSLIVVIARNIAKYLPSHLDMQSSGKIVDMLNYIQANIYYPERIRTDVLASSFGLSEKYLGKYFRQHTGQNLSQYVNSLRLKLLEARLLFSDFRIGEIAHELAFSDESHMNKFFKKAKGISPSEFRKNYLESKKASLA